MDSSVALGFWAIVIGFLLYRFYSKKRKSAKAFKAYVDDSEAKSKEAILTSSYLPRTSDEELMEELEDLIAIDDEGGSKKLVRKFIKEYKEMGLYLPPKVYARAMAFLEDREWMTEEQFKQKIALEEETKL